MTPADQFRYGDAPPVAELVTAARPPLDLDRVHEVVVAIGSFLLYLVGTIGGAFALGDAFGAWVGYLLLLAAGGLPSLYSLRKAAQRRDAREAHARLEASREPSREFAPGPPILP